MNKTLREWFKGFTETRLMEFPVDAGFLALRKAVNEGLAEGEWVLRTELRGEKKVIVIGTRCDSNPASQPSA